MKSFDLNFFFLFIHFFTKVDSRLCNALNESLPGKAIEVKIRFLLYNIDVFDDVLGDLSTMGTIVISWHDPCAWKVATEISPNWSRFTTSAIPIPKDSIWIPPIINFSDSEHNLVITPLGTFPLYPFPDGLVEMWVYQLWKTKCQVSLKHFPFDNQHCTYSFTSWLPWELVNITSIQVDMKRWEDPQTSLWNVKAVTPKIKTHGNTCNKKGCTFSTAEYGLQIERKWSPYYVHRIFIPLFCIVTVQLATFLIPLQYLERSSFAMTIFLAFAVMRIEIQNVMPQTSENILILTAINSSLIASMVITAYSCVVLVQNKKNPERSFFIDRIAFVIFLLFYSILYISILALIFT